MMLEDIDSCITGMTIFLTEANFSSFRCSCNDACRSTIYGVEQSATTLSELGIDRLLDNDTSHLKERYDMAHMSLMLHTYPGSRQPRIEGG